MTFDILVKAQGFILLKVQRTFWPANGEGPAVNGVACPVLEFTCIHLFNSLNNPCELDIILLILQPRKQAQRGKLRNLCGLSQQADVRVLFEFHVI